MRTVVAIADAGSLTGAARALDSSLPAVVRLLAALEAEVGTLLFHRTTRQLALTDAGRRYVERCREVEALVGEAEAELHAEQTEPQGVLRVTAPVFFGARHVSNGITSFIQRYPAVTVDFLLLDRVVNLAEEGIDVGVRIGALEDSSLIARPVGAVRRLTVAAPAYLARHAAPEHPKDLLDHNCIRLLHGSPSGWAFSVSGKRVNVPVRGNLVTNHVVAATTACVAGLGISNFSAYQVAPELASGALRVLLASFEPEPRPIHVIYPQARLLPTRTRVFVEFMRRYLASEQRAWQPAERKAQPESAVRAKRG
jgi:DNA-binding transcriptional LysR family regulator